MRRAAVTCGLALTLLSGCRDAPPASETPAPEALAPEPADLAAGAATTLTPAVRARLEPTPHPDLSALQQAVRQQLEEQLTELETLLDQDAAPAAELAERFGLLGRLYQGYGLEEPAAVAYRNAQRSNGSDPRWPYLLAVVALASGDRETAASHLERTRELAPDDLPAALRLAELRLEQDDLDAAEALFRQAFERHPESAFAVYGLARVASARRDYETAVERFRQVLELQPEANSVHYLLGQAYARLGDRQAAEEQIALRGGVPASFDDPLVDGLEDLLTGVGIHLEQGLEALGDGDTEAAIAEYRAALAIEPDNATALRGVALALASANRNEEALREYERMLEIHPDHQLARMEHGTVLLNLGRTEQAIVSFRKALEKDPDFKAAQKNLAGAYLSLERWPEAAAGFREVLRIDRDDIQAHFYLGVALDEMGSLDEAAAELRQALQRNPDHLLARQRLGSVLDRAGDPEGALTQFRAVLGLQAPDEEKALAHYQIGRLLQATGREDESLDHFQRSAELFPRFWQARFAIANWYARRGRHREAAEIFGRIAAADSTNLIARQREAESLMGDGRFALARTRLEEGLTAEPRSFELNSSLARLLATAPDAELRDGERALRLAESLFQARRTIEQAEIVAMALAELERFEEAAALQRQIVGMAESEGRAEALPRLRRNLAGYESRQPVRQAAG